jgi:hypothetical protein
VKSGNNAAGSTNQGLGNQARKINARSLLGGLSRLYLGINLFFFYSVINRINLVWSMLFELY